MAELDQGYKNLISVILNLNHDRYKSFFNYFIILHLGLFTAIGSGFGNKIGNKMCFGFFLSVIGIVLAIAWWLVQYKIQRDIREAWHAIEEYEKSDKYHETLKISDARWKCCKGWSASKIMLLIPFCFFLAYVFFVFSMMSIQIDC